MHPHGQYIMRDQMHDRVQAIMGDRVRRPRHNARRRARPRWLARLALAASTAALSLARSPLA